MQFLVITSAAFAFVLVLLLFSRPRRVLGAKERRVKHIAETDKLLLDELNADFHERFILPLLKKLRRTFSRLTKSTKKEGAINSKMERQLRMAGMYIGASGFLVVRVMVALGLFLVTAILLRFTELEAYLKLLMMIAALMVGLLVPVYYMRFQIRSRQSSIRNQLPDMIDILTVSIDAGLSFDIALRRALDKFTGALKEEMTITAMEIQMGKPRRIALTELGERNDVAELKSLASAVVQSEQMGTPIKQVLRTQAAQLRLSRKQYAQEKGMKASVKMLLPMVAFIFPVIFIILLGPTVIRVMDTFK